jgi:TPR repeat protein
MTFKGIFQKLSRSLVFAFIPFLFNCAGSYNLHEGIQSFQVQDYRSAFIRLKPEAKKGNREAQYAVGYMYYYGQGVVEDRKKAGFWIKKAAEQGQADAKKALSLLYKENVDNQKTFHSAVLEHYPVPKVRE